uniref:Chromosome 12 open reading frame 73 n=1 Tax=Lynx canadensis TaxID=61383 RepID=A0A667GAJ8_LYNCA
MPAGVSWATYLKMFAASLLAMCAGAEVVHRYYLPDLRRNRFRRVNMISQDHIA